MPNVPAFIASRAEKWFGAPAEVTEVEPIGRTLRRVVFAGPALRGSSWRPGEAIELRVGPTELRHYTPASWDRERGRFDVFFHLHGRGPGSAWAERLARGDQVFVLGPGESVRLLKGDRHVFVGDETTIGLFLAMSDALKGGSANGSANGSGGANGNGNGSAHGNGSGSANGSGRARVVIEADEDVAAPLAAFAPQITALRRSAARGDVLETWVSENVTPGDAVYLAGHAQTIQRLRKRIIDSLGVHRSQVRIRAYWADGKRGL